MPSSTACTRTAGGRPPTGARLDAGAFVAGLEYAADTEATVLGKPSAAYFAAALEALDAEAGLTWMVGDDLEGDIVGAHKHGMRTVLVRTGKFRPDEVERSRVQPDGIVSSIAQLPDWLEQNPLMPAAGRRRPDRDRADPPCAGAARRELQATLLHRGRARVLRLEAEPAAALRRPLRRQGGGRQGARLGRLLHVEGDRGARPPEAGRPPQRPHGRVGGEGRRGPDRALDDALARAGRGGRGRGGRE